MSNGDSSIHSQSKWLQYIKSEVERMTRLTNDLLYLAQLDYSDTRMIYSNFNLSEAVENVIMTMEAVIYENDIMFEYEVEPRLMVNGNSEQIKQVVMIFLDNSVKYVNTKGRITLSLKKTGSTALLSVSNTGEGIPEDQIARIFDRFYRTDKSRARKSGGYGLGLAIAKSIVEQHRGRISARSTVNESTTFAIELPLVNRQ
jgi:signal transduction histidine kinase